MARYMSAVDRSLKAESTGRPLARERNDNNSTQHMDDDPPDMVPSSQPEDGESLGVGFARQYEGIKGKSASFYA